MHREEITTLSMDHPEIEKVPHATLEVDFPGRRSMEGLSLEDRQETLERLDQLKLENQFFRVHTHEEMDMDEIREKIKDPETNVYLLLHGWTGTGEIFDSVHKADGKTIVEEILETDPNAVIICPDGNGFGQTNFKEMHLNILSHHCRPEDYADQMELLVDKMLGMKPEDRHRLYVMGHSMGAATTMLMAGKGYVPAENCVAVCPAALPSTKERDTVEFNEDDFSSVRRTYKQLGSLVEVGHLTKNQIGGSLSKNGEIGKAAGHALGEVTDTVVGATFEYGLSGPLMGLKNPGSNSPEQMESIVTELRAIHGEQANKVDITSAAMKALENGVRIGPDFFNGDTARYHEFMIRMANVDVVAGEKDILAPVHQFKNLVDTKANGFGGVQENYGRLEVVAGAGHYATLYEPGEQDPTALLVSHVARNKRIPSLIPRSEEVPA